MAGVLKAKVGGVWVPVVGSGMSAETARWNSAWGIVAVGTLPNGQTALTATQLTLSTVTLPTISGRRYKASFALRTWEAFGGAVNSVIVKLAGIPSDTAFNDHYIRTDLAAQGYGGGGTATWLFDGTGTTLTLTLTAAMYAGTGQLHSQAGSSSRFFIEDVGPTIYNAAPAPVQYPGPWTALGLLSGWVHSGLPRPVPSYRLTGDVVELRFAVKNGAPNTPLAALPVGARPPYVLDVYGRDNAGPGVFNIAPDGGITWYGAAGNNGLVALSMSFSTTA